MTLDAFIFDLDGTLVDTELLWAKAMHAYLMSHNCYCSEQDVLRMVYGLSWTDIHRHVTKRFPAFAHLPALEMGDALRTFYLKLRNNSENIIIRSSVALLRQLVRDYPVIVVSGSPRHDVEEAMRLLGTSDLVRFVLGAEDYAPGKPAPAGFLLGAHRLGTPSEHCLVFEDSRAGVLAAKRAGMWCVAVNRAEAHPQDLSEADWILSDLADFSIPAFKQHVTRTTKHSADNSSCK